MRRHLPLTIALTALLISLLANPSVTQAVAAKIKGKQIANNSIAEKKLKASVRTKLNRVGTTGPQGPVGPAGPKGDPGDPGSPSGAAGGVLGGTYPNPSFANNAVAPDASKLDGLAAAAYQQKCTTGTLKAAVDVSISAVSTTDYTTAGLTGLYMCVPGTIYARRIATGIVNVVFHPAGQSGQFGANVGTYSIASNTATGAGYMVKVGNAGNPGDPPATFSSILAYRLSMVDDAGTAVNQSARIMIF